MKKILIILLIVMAASITITQGQTFFNTWGGLQTSIQNETIFVPPAVFFRPLGVAPPDTTPPIISNLAEVIGNDSINITWDTDENANYTIQLSTGDNFTNASFAISFFQNITGLLNNTFHSYNITACDTSGNCNTTINFNFTTLQNPGPVLDTICTDTVNINTSCTMVSPVLTTCTNYTIHNLTGTLIQNVTNLTQGFVPGTFFFVFNESAGQYVVSFCDGTTKEVLVTAAAEDNNMAFAGIGIIIVGMMFFGIYFGTTISTNTENEKLIKVNNLLKFILSALSLFILYFAAQLAYGIALENSFTGNITASLSTINWLVLILGFVVLILIFWGSFVNEALAFKDWIFKGFGINLNRRRKK